MRSHYTHIAGLLVLLGVAFSAQAEDDAFARWLTKTKEQALSAGISPTTVEAALADIDPDPRVVKLDQKQPEKKITLTRYLANTISDRRIATGKAMLKEHADSLARAEAKYGVPREYIVALWGIESDFGNHTGGFSIVRSLATLAFEGRRAEFFSRELLDALKILDQEGIALSEFSGSWAGAMGQSQFMPSTYLRHAADGNGDGVRDIWNTPDDVFASIASYLNHLGWDARQGWGRAVVLPDDFRDAEANIKQGKTASDWRARGLVYGRSGFENGNDGGPIPEGKEVLYAIYPGTADEGALLVTENFQRLLQWNRSRYFATAVGTLADAIRE